MEVGCSRGGTNVQPLSQSHADALGQIHNHTRLSVHQSRQSEEQ